jgi:3-dehydroquinate dehydratase/shikimate dehydrogenase
VNNGKLCISICVETTDELRENLRRAEELADVIEVRFDCLRKEDLETLLWPWPSPRPLDKIKTTTLKPIISTFRSKEQGGRRLLEFNERSSFWTSGYETDYCDVEEEFVDETWSWLWQKRICSFHDLSGVPSDILDIFDHLKSTKAEIVKIAVQANDVSDAIPVWKLLEYSKSYKPWVIPIAMGEAGTWTRILGLAHGAYLTYASLDTGGETAPGQLTAREMIDVYRVKELDLETKVYGVIGDPVSSSLSPVIHNAAFVADGLNAVFIPLLVKDLDEFMRRMVLSETREVELNFAGFAVTMPHKQEVIKYLDGIDDVATTIGAVNTISIENGKLIGYNTDAAGFIEPLKRNFGDLQGARVAVIGAGGAARACVYALRQKNAEVTILARDVSKAVALADEFGAKGSDLTKFKDPRSKISANFDIIVNATPLGMKGKLESQSPFTADELSGVKFVFDLVTSAGDTPLIREAKRAGVPAIGGEEMLLEQAAKQYEIWTGRPAPLDIMRNALNNKQRETQG